MAPSRKNMNLKLVYCIRTDLKMQKGKMMSQIGHATIGIYEENLFKKQKKILDEWKNTGQAKIVLKIKDEREMNRIRQKAIDYNLITHTVIDAGKTQITSGSKTVLVIGPCYENKLNMVTGNLKLM
jgi:PTH2 family peptidyl-tRNA hydrolase